MISNKIYLKFCEYIYNENKETTFRNKTEYFQKIDLIKKKIKKNYYILNLYLELI